MLWLMVDVVADGGRCVGAANHGRYRRFIHDRIRLLPKATAGQCVLSDETDRFLKRTLDQKTAVKCTGDLYTEKERLIAWWSIGSNAAREAWTTASAAAADGRAGGHSSPEGGADDFSVSQDS